MTEPRTAAVIGLGAMGLPIAQALIAGGWRLRVCDMVAERTDALADCVALRTTSPAEAATGSDAVLAVVASDQQLEQAVLGADGALERMRPGSLLIVHSTVSPAICRRLAAAAAPRDVAVVDAAMSGGVAGAETRTLTTMVGGSDEALGRARPVLECYSTTIFHVGEVGLGETAKLVNNLIATVQLAVTAEALRLGRAAGLASDVALRIINSSTGRCWASEGWDAILTSFERSPGGLDHVRANVLRKDLDLVEQLAAEMAVGAPMTAAAKHGLGGIVSVGSDGT